MKTVGNRENTICKEERSKSPSKFTKRGPWVLSLCLWCLTTCPDIQISFMNNGHVAEVKISCFLRCKFIYAHLFHCIIKTTKWPWNLQGQRYSIYMFTVTPDLKISHHFSLRTLVFELQPTLSEVHQTTPKWPWTLKSQRYRYKIGFIDIWADFQNCHIWLWNLAIGQSSRSYTSPKVLLSPKFHSVLLYSRSFSR